MIPVVTIDGMIALAAKEFLIGTFVPEEDLTLFTGVIERNEAFIDVTATTLTIRAASPNHRK